jgi:hypothetical protein
MADNATNNDTLLDAYVLNLWYCRVTTHVSTSIQAKCEDLDIPFEARHARMRCIAHIVHLAAVEVMHLQ